MSSTRKTTTLGGDSAAAAFHGLSLGYAKILMGKSHVRE
jgi:hypothetical protein